MNRDSPLSRPLKVFMTAGEPSGDVLGADLMRALTQFSPDGVTFSGVGGNAMRAAGLASIFPMSDLSVMGVFEILPRLPLILRRIDQAAVAVAAFNPDLIVTIDAPDFSFRVLKKLKSQNTDMPTAVHYVAPTVWAWRPKRAGKVAALYDGIMCLLPFEPPYFTREGMFAAFTGHPMIRECAGVTDENVRQFKTRYRLNESTIVLGALFGSRRGEIKRMGPVWRRVIDNMIEGAGYSNLHILAPTLPHLADDVSRILASLPCQVSIISDTEQKWPAFRSMNAAFATSGTIGLELSVAGVPHVIGYKMNPMTWQIVSRLVKSKYAHLGNILAGEEIVPEFIQNNCTAAKISPILQKLLTSNDLRAVQTEKFAAISNALGGQANGPPGGQAAAFCLDLSLPAYSRRSMAT